MKRTFDEELPEDWIAEADPKHKHFLVAALILALEKGKSRGWAQETVYEITRVLGKRFALYGALHVVEQGLALFRPDGPLADREEPMLDEHFSTGAWCRVLRRAGHRIVAPPWAPWKKHIVLSSASRLVGDAGTLASDNVVRDLVAELEATFLITLPQDPPPDRQKGVGVASKP